ncbi:hypothetical protein [Mycolicibacterium wolinskyi]|uniref:hypothetical protein n=1 Tax=Mycolicibacterium wolinskyi TaxID=59750 RepID=UPI003BAD913D
MAIHLEVYTRLNERDIRRNSDRIKREYDDAGRDAGALFGNQFSAGVERSAPKVEKSMARVEKATDKVADAMGRVRSEQAQLDALDKRSSATREQKIKQAERLAAAQRAEAAAIREASRAHSDHSRNLVNIGRSGDGAASALTSLGTTIGSLGRVGGVAGMAVLAGGLVNVAGVAASAAGSLALLPGAAGAAAAGLGTLKLATLGFGDAMDSIRDPEKFAEALQSLSPNAQQAALRIRELLPEFDKLKNATQDSFFAGVSDQLDALSRTLLPTVQTMTTSIASSFNQMFMGITNQLMQPGTRAELENIANQVGAAFRELAPAAAPLTEAFADIMSVGADFMPELARGAADAATGFRDLVAGAKESGKIHEWIDSGLTTLGQLKDITVDVGKAFLELKPIGEQELPKIANAVDDISNSMETLVGWLETTKNIVGLIVNPLDSIKGFAEQLGLIEPGTRGISDYTRPSNPNLAPPGGGVPQAQLQAPAGARESGGLPTTIFGVPSAQATAPAGTRESGGLPPAITPAPSPPLPVPAPPTPGGASGPRLPDAPVLPLNTTLPAGIPGMPQTAATFNAESSYLEAQHTLAEKRARLAQLEKTTAATADDVQKARNDVVEADRDAQAAEMRLNEARQNQYEQMTRAGDRYAKQLQKGAAQLGEIGARLDADFGISKGLAGIAENITKFVANLAAAPLLGQLDAIAQANPTQGGHGIMGILGAQGAFGPQYMNNQYAQGSGGSVAAMGPPALQPGMNFPMPAGLPRQYQSGMVPNNVRLLSVLESMFPELKMSADTGRRDSFGEHGSGQALDIMVGANQALGDQINEFLLQNADALGLQYNIWKQATWRPDGSVSPMGDRGSPTQNHMDHVHARVKPGPIGGGGSVSLTTPWGAPNAYPFGPTTAGAWATNPAPLPTSMPGGPIAAGAPTAAPFANRTYGGSAPASGTGQGGVSMMSGGLLDTAIGVGASGLDMLAPGAGQAAQTATKLINRTIQYGGQVGGILAQGALETLVPFGGSELANNNWITRIVGGLAGAAPALPNLAGKSTQAPTPEQVAGVDPNTTQHGAGNGQPVQPGPTIQVTNQRATEDGTGRDIAWHLEQANRGPGM